MNDPGKRGQRQDLKENKAGHQIRGEHHALRGKESQDRKEPITLQMLSFMLEVLKRKQRRKCPHPQSDQAVDHTEAVCSKMQPSDKDLL